MADITKNPPKDETTPGRSIESRKTGDKKVVEELQEFNTKTNELGKDVKSGFRAIVEGIKEGNEEMNPKEREKTQIKGFKKLSDAQQDVVDIFGDMKTSADRSSATMAKEMAVERITGLETGREQFNLWERMLLRLVGIDEDLDILIANSLPRDVKGQRNWLGKLILGGLVGGVIGLIAGIVFGLGEVVLFYLKMVGKFVRFLGGKFINSKLMAPIVNPIKNFFARIGTFVSKFGKAGGGWMTKNLLTPLRSVRAQFLHGFGLKKGGVLVKGMKGFQKQNIFSKIGAVFGRIGALWTKIWAPIKAFNAQTVTMWRSLQGTAKGVKGGGGIISRFLGMFGGLWGSIKAFFLPFGFAAKKVGIWAFKVGRVIGRFGLITTLILGAIDGIIGAFREIKAMDGPWWKKTIAGVFGFMKGAINGIIMIPLDLILAGVAWIIGLFGEPGQAIKKAMNKFSLEDIFTTLYDMLFGAIMGLVDWIVLLFSDPGAAIAKAVTGINNLMDQFMKWILGMILPDPRGLHYLHPKSIVAGVLPDSLYEYAGLDPATGLPPPEPGEMGPPAPEPGSEGLLGKTAGWISGLFEKEDPVLALKPGEGLVPLAAGAMGPPSPVVLNSGGNVTKEGDTTINVVGGDSSGEETRWRLFSRFRD
jgi:hypothetical protein